jgi:hypothetical protein
MAELSSEFGGLPTSPSREATARIKSPNVASRLRRRVIAAAFALCGCPETPGDSFDEVIAEETRRFTLERGHEQDHALIQLDVKSEHDEELSLSELRLIGLINARSDAIVAVALAIGGTSILALELNGPLPVDSELAVVDLERSSPRHDEICATFALTGGVSAEIFMSGALYRWQASGVDAEIHVSDEPCE